MYAMRARNISSAVATALAAALAMIVVSSAVGQDAAPYTDPFADPDEVDGRHVVYYQVVYADDDIRDLSAVPTTNEDITSVLRISRIGSAVGSYERIHTGDPTVRDVGTPEVTREYLLWNGTAWVGADDAVTDGADSRARALSAEFDRAQATLEVLETHLADCDHLVAGLERELQRAVDDGDGAEIERQLKEARDKQEGLVATIEDYQRQASVLKDALADGGDLLAENGQVHVVEADVQVDAGDEPERPAVSEVTLDHGVQVWRVKRSNNDTGQHLRRYEVSMPHAVAGAHGAFYYVAYADTTGDGRPDTRIAQSPLASANRPGQWTSWTFTTDRAEVFVGNAWPRADTSHYVVTPSSQRGSTGVAECPNLEQIAHIGGIWWEGPGTTDHRFGAYLTNINLNVLANPDPDADDGRFDSGITEK